MVIVVGSLNMDLVIRAPKIPRPGETILGSDFKQVSGGKGANQADAAAKLGTETIMLGAVGNDSMGKRLKDSLERDGVNVQMVLEKDDSPTGVAAIVVEDSGNNAITVAPGANSGFSSKDLLQMENAFKGADVMLVQLETPLDTVKTALKLAKKNNVTTILNPAPAMNLDDEIYTLVDVLTPNETELELLSNMETDTSEKVEAAGRLLLEKGVSELVVTLGSQGSMHIGKDFSQIYPAYKVKAVDTTAAGDSFNAALAVSLANGSTMEESILFATKVGAMTVTKHGAQTSLPLLQEVEQFEKWYEKLKLKEER
ncbi:ribokinase [Gudongella sp. DL1XJH-153]|uniref:ribokinase n=1 Tax=Gudongella sp. DL1XJH-153 TaxID=3409804 RepID=UPI003BB5291C